MKTRFVLIETSHAGNVGAAARAMKVMGFDDLVLVRPRWPNVLRRQETIARASGANDVLAQARIVASLDEALQGVTHVCATAMTARDFGPPTRSPREHLPALAQDQAARPDAGVAFLFGSERWGMSNADVYKAHVALRIPTDARFGSLNLAAAIQVLAYEWRLALGEEGAHTTERLAERLADAQALQGLLAHWQEALVALEFLDPQSPKKLMPRLNQLLNRAQLREQDIHILRGVAKAVLQLSARAERP